jgi:hypothetical protein
MTSHAPWHTYHKRSDMQIPDNPSTRHATTHAHGHVSSTACTVTHVTQEHHIPPLPPFLCSCPSPSNGGTITLQQYYHTSQYTQLLVVTRDAELSIQVEMADKQNPIMQVRHITEGLPYTAREATRAPRCNMFIVTSLAHASPHHSYCTRGTLFPHKAQHQSPTPHVPSPPPQRNTSHKPVWPMTPPSLRSSRKQTRTPLL